MVVRQSARTFVERVAFRTSLGDRVSTVITDLGEMRRDAAAGELVLARVHPGVEVDAVRAATGWDLTVDDDLEETLAPALEELEVLRQIQATRGQAA